MDLGEHNLTPQQVAFLNHPEAITNTTKAAMEVGYSKNYAENKIGQIRDRYMPQLLEKLRARLEGLSVSPEWVKNEVVILAATAPADFMEFIEDAVGNQYTVLKKSSEIDQKKWRAAIKEVEFDTYIDTTGAMRSRVSKIKFYDRQAALVELANIFGMKNEKMLMAMMTAERGAKTEDDRLLEEMTPEELEAIASIQEEALDRMKIRASKKRDAKAIDVKSGGSDKKVTPASPRANRTIESDSAPPNDNDKDDE